MKQQFGVFATAIFAGTLVLPAAVRAQTEGVPTNSLTISVKIYNWAKVSTATLQKGQEAAGEIFKEAGVELRWAECPCEAGSERITLSLRILPKLFGSNRSKFHSDRLGFAAANEDGGDLATIFYDRIESVGRGADLSQILGLVTAHELGHLLLGTKAHIDKGIMKPYWTRQSLRKAHRTALRFSPEQSQAIRQRAVQSLAMGNGTASGSVRNTRSPS